MIIDSFKLFIKEVDILIIKKLEIVAIELIYPSRILILLID